jgi:SNF2 family DNA or RNA helicase
MKEYHAAKLYGGMSTRDRDKVVQKFMGDEKCRVMVANIQAGAWALTGSKGMQPLRVPEFSHTPNDHRQAEDRLHRGGQGVPVNSYYLVAKGTIDMDAIEVLDQRAKMLDGVMDGKAPVDMDLLTGNFSPPGRS